MLKDLIPIAHNFAIPIYQFQSFEGEHKT